MRGRPLSLRKGAVVLAVLAVSACTHENARPVEPAAVSPPIENYVLRAEPSIIVQVKPAEDTMYVISCEGSTTISCASVSVRVRVNEP